MKNVKLIFFDTFFSTLFNWLKLKKNVLLTHDIWFKLNFLQKQKQKTIKLGKFTNCITQSIDQKKNSKHGNNTGTEGKF